MTRDNERHLDQARSVDVGFDGAITFSGPQTGQGEIAPITLYDLLAVRQFAEREQDQQEVEEEQDVPAAVEPGSTSSVGALWPPDKAPFERIKGIYTPGIVINDRGMDDILQEINKAEDQFRRDRVTRVSFRAVVDNAFLAHAREANPRIAELIEAQFSLSGTQAAFEGSSLVYLGSNHPSRQPLELEKIEKNVSDAFRHPTQTPSETLSRIQEQGYVLSTLPKDVDADTVDQVSALYERFGWSKEEVEDILSKQNNIIAVASINGEIVSAGIAEMVRIPIGDHDLRIVEITEAATKEEHSRRGLYTAVSTSLLLQLAKMSKEGKVLDGEIDLVYGECNGNAPGVLKTARIQGRRFAFEDGPGGILFQHVPIAGLPKITRYNDLFPAYISRQDLYGRYLNETA